MKNKIPSITIGLDLGDKKHANRGAGFAADLEKYLEAALAGWRVVRLGPNELTTAHVVRLVALVRVGQ